MKTQVHSLTSESCQQKESNRNQLVKSISVCQIVQSSGHTAEMSSVKTNISSQLSGAETARQKWN